MDNFYCLALLLPYNTILYVNTYTHTHTFNQSLILHIYAGLLSGSARPAQVQRFDLTRASGAHLVACHSLLYFASQSVLSVVFILSEPCTSGQPFTVPEPVCYTYTTSHAYIYIYILLPSS